MSTDIDVYILVAGKTAHSKEFDMFNLSTARFSVTLVAAAMFLPAALATPAAAMPALSIEAVSALSPVQPTEVRYRRYYGGGRYYGYRGYYGHRRYYGGGGGLGLGLFGQGPRYYNGGSYYGRGYGYRGYGYRGYGY